MAKKIQVWAHLHSHRGEWFVDETPHETKVGGLQKASTLVVHGDEHERVFTESEVRAIMGPLMALSSARLNQITVKGVEYMEAENVEFAFARLKDIAVRLGLYFDPA